MKKGFTMIELMVGIVIFGIIIMTTLMILNSLQKSYIKSVTVSSRSETLTTTMNIIEREMERSFYLKKISDTEAQLKVKASDTDIDNGISNPYIIDIFQNTENKTELNAYKIGKKDDDSVLTPTSSSPETLYSNLVNADGSVKFTVITTDRFTLPETVIFPLESKTFVFYDEYADSYTVSGSTVTIPGIIIGSYKSTGKTEFQLVVDALGSDTAPTLNLSISYLEANSILRVETYNAIELNSSVGTEIKTETESKTVVGSFPATLLDGKLSVTITNASSVDQLKIAPNSIIILPYDITAGQSAVVYLKGDEGKTGQSKVIELTNTISSMKQ